MDLENKYGCLEIQENLLDLLKQFHSFCKSNGIKYSLAYGSLLGAIRHKGFIPWDDDLDILVDRHNYELLIKTVSCSDVFDLERVLWIHRIRRHNDKAIRNGYIPTLDVLVLDNTPDSAFAQKIKFLRILILQGMMKRKPSAKGNLLMKICSAGTWLLGLLFPYNCKFKWYQKVSQISNDIITKKQANYNGEYSDLKRLYKKGVMDDIIEISFEDTVAYSVKSYHEMLTIEFGDYMTPPKESDRTPRHS